MIATINYNKVNKVNIENIYLINPIKNKIMPGGMFSRIVYSSESSTMNGIYIDINLKGIISEVYLSKYNFQFCTKLHVPPPGIQLLEKIQNDTQVLQKICQLERDLLNKYLLHNGKTPQYTLREQLLKNNFNFVLPLTTNKDNIITNEIQNIRFILKISGIWSTTSTYGITYKFIHLKS